MNGCVKKIRKIHILPKNYYFQQMRQHLPEMVFLILEPHIWLDGYPYAIQETYFQDRSVSIFGQEFSEIT